MIDLKTVDLDAVARRVEMAIARHEFYRYCKLKYPKAYRDDRPFLKEMCEKMQWFIESSDKRFLVVTVPPRHFKSFTGTALAEWLFGKYWLAKKIITSSYNERLSTTFARKVRDTIAERPAKGGPLVYRNIFPKTKVKYGQASMQQWALEGSTQDNYLATSPGGTATGFGADIGIVDDIIKNALEAYNETVLDGQWDWFTNTFMQRFEGDNWKCIIIMTRWATRDLAGRVIEAYPDQVEQISFSAVQPDGKMLCDSILNRASYDVKTQEMNPDIVEANYNQKPIDVKGRLYDSFPEYDKIPKDVKKWNYTDTADQGTDFLCSVDFVESAGDVYVTDVVMTDDGMEETEPAVAQMLHMDGVDEAIIESNNGGRGFGRNIERILKEIYANVTCTITAKNQSANKEARILTSSAWASRHIHMPHGWEKKWPEFYKQLMAYQKKGKNAHDDAPDVLAGIYEMFTVQAVEYADPILG